MPACSAPISCRTTMSSSTSAPTRCTLLSPDHCPGKVIYWPATAVAAVPMRGQFERETSVFPVTVDGKAVNATLDTGSTTTILNLGFAGKHLRSARATSSGVTTVTALDSTHGSAVLSTRFKTLTFGDDADRLDHGRQSAKWTCSPTSWAILARRGSNTGTAPSPRPKAQSVALPDMLLGMNVLKHLHIYIAYGEEPTLHHARNRTGEAMRTEELAGLVAAADLFAFTQGAAADDRCKLTLVASLDTVWTHAAAIWRRRSASRAKKNCSCWISRVSRVRYRSRYPTRWTSSTPRSTPTTASP